MASVALFKLLPTRGLDWTTRAKESRLPTTQNDSVAGAVLSSRFLSAWRYAACLTTCKQCQCGAGLGSPHSCNSVSVLGHHRWHWAWPLQNKLKRIKILVCYALMPILVCYAPVPHTSTSKMFLKCHQKALLFLVVFILFGLSFSDKRTGKALSISF